MERELKIGQHLVFIDANRVERDALLICIHGDAHGQQAIPIRKAADKLTEEEKSSGEWENDIHTPPIYAYKLDENGNPIVEYKEPGEHWPCINIVVVDKNEGAEDQYGRQTSKEHTSVVHWIDSTAVGYCWRFADEQVDRSMVQPPIK